jgi:serine/threonine-protein kinase
MTDDEDVGTLDTLSLPELKPDRSASVSALQPGDVVGGRYQLIRPLGEGAMGQVFLGRHTGLNKEVAVKVIKPEVQASAEYVRRFEREARATSSLDHPHVVRVLDFGEEPALFIVMEYIQGRSLRHLIRETKTLPSLHFVTTIVDQMLSGLAAAHEHGIIHRDLKPDNVLLTGSTEEPFVKVVDFGLARVEESFELGPTLTQQGVVAGTPPYMSPEQCQSMAVTSASDLYSIGCVLTELLQLTPPFAGDSAAVIMSQQMFSPPPPLERPEGAEPVPDWLESLRLQLLAKHAHRRPESARAARERLRAADEAEREPRRSGRGSMGEGSGRFERFGTGERLLIRLVGNVPSVDAAVRAGLALHAIDVGAIGGPSIVLVEGEAGDELAQRIAERDAEGLSVIACVPNPRASDLPQLISAGAADIVPVPVDPVALAVTIRRLERRRQRQRKK